MVLEMDMEKHDVERLNVSDLCSCILILMKILVLTCLLSGARTRSTISAID